MSEGWKIEELLEPIPGENLAGEPTPFAIRNTLEEKRKEVDPDDFDADDPARPTEAKKADWHGIIETAKDCLKNTSKDLLVAARLTEALTKVYGFAGLTDGLAVMQGITEQCWDRCYPEIENGDLESRIGPYNWLCDSGRGAKFPFSVRAIPMLRGPDGTAGWRERNPDSKSKFAAEMKATFDKAFAATSPADCVILMNSLNDCLKQFNSLSEAIDKRFVDPGKPPDPEKVPALSDLRVAIGDCHTLAKLILKEKGPPPDEMAALAATGEMMTGGAGVTRASSSREDIYTRLRQAADDLERLEPHSPIPHLLRRAGELGSMKFPELIRALLGDGATLSSIEKEFGLKQEASSAPSE